MEVEVHERVELQKDLNVWWQLRAQEVHDKSKYRGLGMSMGWVWISLTASQKEIFP